MAWRQAGNIEVPDSNIVTGREGVFWKSNLFRKLLRLSKRTCDYFSKMKQWFETLHISVYRYRTRSRDSLTSIRPNHSLDHWCSILFLSTIQNALYLSHFTSGDFTTVEINAAIEQTLNNSCSQSLARKRDSWKLESIFSKHFSSGWIWLVPNLSLLKHFDVTLPRQKSSKIEGSGPPLIS